MNSATSLFDTSQSNPRTNRERVIQARAPVRELPPNCRTTTEETKESGDNTYDIDLLSLSVDEFSEVKNENVLSTNSEEDDMKIGDEEIEMERVMKMNFYQFRSQNQNGIVGMCQKIKTPSK